MTTATGQTLQMNYDVLRRLSSVSSDLYTKQYTYKDYSNRTTGLVSQVQYTGLPTSLTFGYTYDALGNIATYTAPDGEVITYTYDNLGQLLSAADDQNYNYTYTYDSAGNILTANGHTYDYRVADWKDLLTAFDGQEIDYDASGNPLSYYNGTRWNFTWKNGRNLVRASSENGTILFEYDSDGLRTKKTVSGGAAHNYFYAGGQLLRETYDSNVLDFSYDANGCPYALKYNGTTYYYITNLQGDVMYLVDGTGATVASYEYDPYGNIVSATGPMAEINPLRYRGYYYDAETGFYYVSSRYFDSVIGRWLNPDAVLDDQTPMAMNLYVYCYNNPTTYCDDSGFWPVSISVRKIATNTLRIQVSASLSNLATALMLSLTIDLVGAAVCGVIPGAQVGSAVLAISAALKGLAVYLLDKYGGKLAVYVYADVKYEVKSYTHTYWICWPFIKNTTTIRTFGIKKITTGWGIA